MPRLLLFVATAAVLSAFSAHAQSACSAPSQVLDWRSLREAAQPATRGNLLFNPTLLQLKQPQNGSAPTQPATAFSPPNNLSKVFLPRWSAADLPVFCRIEHEIGVHLPVMVKFRLGSVEYVDWLEGKGH